MKNINELTLFELLQKNGYLFYIQHPDCKGLGTLLFKEGKYTYLPEFSRGFELSEEKVIEILENKF